MARSFGGLDNMMGISREASGGVKRKAEFVDDGK